MLIDFTKFCFAAAGQFFLTGFILAGVFVFIFDSAADIPGFFKGVLTALEILTVIFGLSGIAALIFLALRATGRKVAEIAFRKLFA